MRNKDSTNRFYVFFYHQYQYLFSLDTTISKSLDVRISTQSNTIVYMILKSLVPTKSRCYSLDFKETEYNHYCKETNSKR